MSRPSTSKDRITGKRFWNLPALGPSIPAVLQADASDEVSSKSSNKIRTHLQDRGEGCLITGFCDLSNELAHFVSTVRTKGRQDEKLAILKLLVIDLKVIPQDRSAPPSEFTLEDASNMSWLSIVLHKHHDNWATIAFSPCLNDLVALEKWFSNDNDWRQSNVDTWGSDPGRDPAKICFSQVHLENKFQLTVLHPRHFHPHPEQSLNVLGTDGRSKPYRASTEGVLKDKDGVPLPPFSLPSRSASTQLNPLLVNFAAALRFRRLKRMDPNLLSNFSTATYDVINASIKLYAAVMWTPTFPKKGEPSAVRVESLDTGDVEIGEGPSNATSRNMEDSGPFAQLFETLGPMNAMDYLMGGYDFEPLPELGDEEEDGVASSPSTPDSAR
ncbi:hypothetical protein B0H11DRAFT_3714 [Mycena galericulata]|nr:hypothetical protein B0H11DRAFT_3714 [Mycena galericulata]